MPVGKMLGPEEAKANPVSDQSNWEHVMTM